MRPVSVVPVLAALTLGVGAAGCGAEDPKADVPSSAKADAPITPEQKAGMDAAAAQARAYGEAKNREAGH